MISPPPPASHCPSSPWACPTTSKSPSRKAPPKSASAPPSSALAQSGRKCRGEKSVRVRAETQKKTQQKTATLIRLRRCLIQKHKLLSLLVHHRPGNRAQMHHLITALPHVHRPNPEIRAIRIPSLRKICPVRPYLFRQFIILRPPRNLLPIQRPKNIFNFRGVIRQSGLSLMFFRRRRR